jgi:muconolactone delta-isomerase
MLVVIKIREATKIQSIRMKHIVHFTYKADSNRQEIAKMIPAELARVAQLQKDGILEAVYVSHDVQQGWLIFSSEDKDRVIQAMQSLPLYPFWFTEVVSVNTPSLG